MNNAVFHLPQPKNEPIFQYAPNTKERLALEQAIQHLKSTPQRIGSIINGKEVYGQENIAMRSPHDFSVTLGSYSPLDRTHIADAIESSLVARKTWAKMPWVDRASIFLKAAELIATKYRYQINAATMLGQSKTAIQAEIDSACELIDFLRFNVYFLNEIYKQQPLQDPPVYNRMQYRPLEGFVLAVTPFNFTAIGANLAAAPAMCGNVVIWKPAYTQLYSAHLTMKILHEAGLPQGVIQMLVVDGPAVSEECIKHKEFAGLHFTGSTQTFNLLWKNIAQQLEIFRSYPRIVGETGGKDFIFVHPSADVDVAVNAMLRGSYEFQGQKCSAASRAYIPQSLAPTIKQKLTALMSTITMGSVEDFSNFMGAVIDKKSFDKIASYIDRVKTDKDCTIVSGGTYDDSKGYFITPTLIETKNPRSLTMCEEIFGPVLTYYIYEDNQIEQTLQMLDETSPYALTGSVIAQDRNAIEWMSERLENSAGNFYINDKPTGAVVGNQPFGGARKSGTNDKAGSHLNMLRWLSPRTIKENMIPPTDYRYPHMEQ